MRLETNPARGAVFAVASALLALSILACGPLTLTTVPAPTKTPLPTTVVPPTQTPTPMPTERPTPTPTLTPTHTPSPTATSAAAKCPPPGSPQLVQPANFADYSVAIQQFLTAGGDVETLRSELVAWGALPGGGPWPSESDALPQVVSADLTGDTVPEVIVALVDPNGALTFPGGALVICGCQAGEYVLHYQETTDGLGVQLLQVSDVNQDDRPDLVYEEWSCGAHTCFHTLRIIEWNGAGFANLIGGTLSMPYPTYTVTPGRIEAQSGGIGSVGAEPQRGYSEVWRWNGSVFTVTEQIWAPPVYRYHALLDGDRALLSGDYDTALDTYRRVISDETLKEWGEVSRMMSPADERALLAAFARWRLMLTYLQMDRLSDAQATYNRLQADYSAGAAGHDVAVMGETFWAAYLAEGRVPDGCAAVVAAAEANTSLLDFFNQSYGYANPWWEPVDLCPFTD